jgi:alanine racemase
MDQTMIDVTDIAGVQAGDEVVLIGRQGQAEISAEEAGEKLGTNNYETIATISTRLERRYT